MFLKKMTATFGRLNGETLELKPGLNVITAPNESGKTTWAAFLLAMLYGVDTAERTTRTNLPAKTKYQPWSGQSMAGSLELEWQGQDVTLERSSLSRAPMASFRAYETHSGQDMPWREDTCGQTLVGVERSVYERSGFIRQQGLALSGDHALEARLSALVTAGDESISFGEAEKRLRDLRNRRRHNKTGLLPQAEEALRQVQEKLDEQRELGQTILDLSARRQELETRRQELERRCAALRARELAEKRQQLEQARKKWEEQQANLEEKRRTVEGLPPLETLEALGKELDQTAEAAASLRDARARLGDAPAAPSCRPVFEGLDPDQVRRTAEADADRLAALRPAGTWLPALLLALAVCGLVLGGAMLALRRLLPAAAGLAAGVVCLVLSLVRWKKDRGLRQQREVLLQRYDAADAAGIRQAAADYRETLLLHGQQAAAYEARRQELANRQAELESRQQTLRERTAGIAADDAAPEARREAVQRAIHLQKFYLAAQSVAQQARVQYEAVRDAVGELPPEAGPTPEAADGDLRQLESQLAQTRQEAETVKSRLDLSRGRAEASGDPAALAAQQEQLTERIARLEREYQALGLAMDALTAANDTLQTRFSPKINQLAGEYMARLTGERYDRVQLGQDMTVTARPAGDAVTHPLLALSAGTADQLYLAVRLAISQLVLRADAPLVLDDALVAFDDDRLAAAMALLQDLAQSRQILLFTCQSRERAWLEAH